MSLHLDRDRARALGRFVWRRFVDDKCFETAGTLSYTTLFALVPLLAAVFGVLTILPGFSSLGDHLQVFLFRNFVPDAGRAVEHYLLEFAGNARKLTTLGIIVFLLSAVAMLASIEERFNRIWRVAMRRNPVSRVLMYWAALTLGPLLAVAGLALTSYITALPFLAQGHTHYLRRHLWEALPFVVTLVGLFAMYELVPNRRIAARHAAVGAVIAAVLFTIAKWVFSLYVRSVPSYREIYGQLAVVPIFLLWVYVSWVIVLLGASLTAAFAAFDYRPESAQLPQGYEFLGLLHLLRHLVAAQSKGRGVGNDALVHCEPFMTDDLLKRYMRELVAQHVVETGPDGQWLVVRNLDQVSLAQLYTSGVYHLPLIQTGTEAWVAELPQALATALRQSGETLSQQLRRPVGPLFEREST